MCASPIHSYSNCFKNLKISRCSRNLLTHDSRDSVDINSSYTCCIAGNTRVWHGTEFCLLNFKSLQQNMHFDKSMNIIFKNQFYINQSVSAFYILLLAHFLAYRLFIRLVWIHRAASSYFLTYLKSSRDVSVLIVLCVN
jgi:hypothetical protein